jgi:CO/xanthine dehydrogenase Mo-binding subunit
MLAGPDWAKVMEFASQVKLVVEPAEDDSGDAPAVFEKRELKFSIEKHDEKKKEKQQPADVVVEGTYRTGLQDPWSSEPLCAVASVEDDKAAIWCASQWGRHLKSSVAAVLGIKVENVTLHQTGESAHFDGKVWYPSLVACQAALASRALRRPVRLALSRGDEFAYTPKRPALEAHIKTEGGRTTAVLKTELGAAGPFAAEMLDRSCLPLRLLYNLGELSITAQALKTNTPPASALCGFSLSQGIFAAERHASELARNAGLDGAEWRLSHLLKTTPYFGSEQYSLYEGVINDVCAASGYRRKWAANKTVLERRRAGERVDPIRGVGLALAFQGVGFLYPPPLAGLSVSVCLEKDSSLSVYCPLSASRETQEIWKKEAAEILGLQASKVKVKTEAPPDSDINDGPLSCLSAHIAAGGGLIGQACREIQKQRFRETLPITVTCSTEPHRAPNWEDKIWDASVFSKLSVAAAVCEIEMDRVSFAPHITGIWLSVDAGSVFSEESARHSLSVSSLAALGWTLTEHVEYVDGKTNCGPADYKLFPASKMPPLNISFVNSRKSEGNDSINFALGLKELPFGALPASILDAVTQAAGIPCSSIPYSPWETAGAVRELEAAGKESVLS